MTCFANDLQPELLDRQPFLFRHCLLGHPALELANLGRMIPALPASQVLYSSGKLERTDNFDRAHLDQRNGMSIEETIDTLRTSNSYIMVREPQDDESFQPLYRELIRDVKGAMQTRGVGHQVHDPKLYLFISSPNSVTPFHIDRYSNFLMQFQGSKQLTVFPQWDERIVPSPVRESVVAYSGQRAVWTPELEALGTRFDFQPGDALHIPFVAGHHVRNGPDEVSISLSFFFNTDETRRLTSAMVFNDHLRRRFQARPKAVGTAPWRDAAKAGLWEGGRSLVQAFSRAR